MKFFLTLLLIASLPALAQTKPDRRFDVAATYGSLTNPGFKQVTAGDQFSASFDYHLPNSRLTLSGSWLTGKFWYYEDQRSNAPDAIILYSRGKELNANNYQLHMGFQVKYRLMQTNAFVWQLGAGLGVFHQRLRYPTRQNGNTFLTESSITDPAFPVSTEAYFRLSPRLALGVKAGAYVVPGVPIGGVNVGPQVRVRF